MRFKDIARLESKITTRNLIEERAQGFVSAELTEHLGDDPAYALKSAPQTSRGRKILKKLPSLKEAFILQVILNRYE